ncbi:TPA: hypothetical protein QCR33_001018 [Bacillus cereus]|nr:hypothetical protein [Bacillus cereus]HDR4608693.1 hypothetical protein [Bacillus cereus]HDR4624549.1 hypothetical protein [Bacillus cereus]HDR4659261.1 hypothetical protein [Bacillus cereus]HDR4927146.1 hypothetical protein [Bacillus cereus]
MIDVQTDVNLLRSLNRKLRRYTLHSKLEAFRKFSHATDPNLRNPALLQSFYPGHSQQYYEQLAKHIYLHELAYLSLASVVAGEWGGPRAPLSTTKEIRSLVNTYRDYSPPFNHKNDTVLEGFSLRHFLVRVAMQQFIYQKNPVLDLYRYYFLFQFQSDDLDVPALFHKAFQYSYDDYVTIATVIYVISSQSTEPLRKVELEKIIGNITSFSSEKIQTMLDVLSMPRELATTIYDRFRSNDERMRVYDYNPMLMKPMIQEGELLYLPIPLYLFSAITEGFYQMLCSKSKTFRADFGKYAYEAYIQDLLEESGITYIPEFQFTTKKQTWRSSDFILVKGNDVILVEVKANAPSVNLRHTDEETYKQQLQKAHIKAIESCIKKEKLIQNGELIHSLLPTKIRRMSYLIVTLEDHYFNDYETVTDMLAEKKLYLHDAQYHTMCTATLESIIDSDQRDIFEFCHECEDKGITYTHYAQTQVQKVTLPTVSKRRQYWRNKKATMTQGVDSFLQQEKDGQII